MSPTHRTVRAARPGTSRAPWQRPLLLLCLAFLTHEATGPALVPEARAQATTASSPAPAGSTSAPGITEPFFDVILSATVPGTVGKRNFKEGDFVRQGQPIIELDKRLEELSVQRRKLVADGLKTELDGDRKLYEATKSVSKEALDKKEIEYKVAEVDYETASEQLRRRQIIAPFDGTITELFLDVGEDCKAQEPVVRLVDTRRCYFVCNIEGRLGHGLKEGQEVTLDIESGNTFVTVKGRLSFVSPVVDPASGLMRVKAVFENPDGKIRPGVAGKLQLGTPSNGR